MKKLDQVLKYHQPTKYIVSKDKYDDKNEIPVLTAGKSFILGYTDEKHGVFDNLPAIIFDDFTTSFHLVDFPFKVKSSAMKILVPISKDVDIRYVYYQMLGLRIDTALHKRYWISKFSKLEVPLPPLETQKRIAQILDDANALRQKTEKLLEEYDTLAQSIFHDMFGDLYLNVKEWETKEILELCLNIVDCVNRTAPVSEVETEYKMIRTTNVKNRSISLTECRTVEKEIYEKWTRRLIPQKGDIVFTREAPLGQAGIINFDDKVFLGQRTMEYRVDGKRANNVFILYQLTSGYVKEQMNRTSSGSTVKHLSVPECKKFKFRVPPIELQNEFAKKIALIEKQKEIAKQELAESEDLFNCLLQKAFKGELK